ncbi:hypothetical protein VR010_14445 [Actinomycetaceae bacterium L2_0104]
MPSESRSPSDDRGPLPPQSGLPREDSNASLGEVSTKSSRSPSWLRGARLGVVLSACLALVAWVLLAIWGPSGPAGVQFMPALALGVAGILGLSLAILPAFGLVVSYRASRSRPGDRGRKLLMVCGGIFVVFWEALLVLAAFAVSFSYPGPCPVRTVGGTGYYECQEGFTDPHYVYYEVDGLLLMSRAGIDVGELPLQQDGELSGR